MSARRRFPPPWSAEETPNCFIVQDANGQQLAHVYYESEPGPAIAAKLLTKDEARRFAANVAKLRLPCAAIDLHQATAIPRPISICESKRE